MNLLSQISKMSQPKPSQNPSTSPTTTSKNNHKNKQTTSIIKDLLDSILSGQLNQDNNSDPQLTRTKNNLLVFLLILSAYGVYYLMGDFLDVLLVACIAGIAYQQSRTMFTQFLLDAKTYERQPQQFSKRIIKIIIWSIIGFIFPRIRYMLTHPHQFDSMPRLMDYTSSIQKTNSYIVIVCQILIFLYILYLLLGKYILKIGKKISPKNVKFIRILFALLTITVVIGLIITIPTIFFKQVTNLGQIIQQKVQQKLGCQIISFKDNGNSNLPLCSEKISSQNNFIRQTVYQFSQQNKTLEECLIFMENLQQQYLQKYIDGIQTISKNIEYYNEIICTWYSFAQKAIAYSGLTLQGGTEDLHKVFSTGTNLFKLFFGNLTWVLSLLSNSIFNITTFITTFLLTIRSGKSTNSTIKQLFSFCRQQLLSSITNLIQAIFFIVIYHFILSVMLLQIFGITPINLIIATILSSMAMFPFFRPWLGVFIVTAIRMIIVQEYYINLTFVILYYVLSQKIYSMHYKKMELHEIVTNMSVLFGIYRFGVAGIFYGPLIIITFQCVQKELFKKYARNNGKANHGRQALK